MKNSFRKIQISKLKVGALFMSVNSYTGAVTFLEIVSIEKTGVCPITAKPPGHECAPGGTRHSFSTDCEVFVP